MIAQGAKHIIADSFVRSNPEAMLLLQLASSNGYTVQSKTDPREGTDSTSLPRPIARQNKGMLAVLGKRRCQALALKEASCFKRFKEDPSYMMSPVPSVCSPIANSQEVIDYLSMSDD
jgi:hypothetical protein